MSNHEYYNHIGTPSARAAKLLVQAAKRSRKLSAGLKLSLIDLEARQGDRAEGESHRERLSEMAPKGDAIV